MTGARADGPPWNTESACACGLRIRRCGCLTGEGWYHARTGRHWCGDALLKDRPAEPAVLVRR